MREKRQYKVDIRLKYNYLKVYLNLKLDLKE